MFKHILVPTDGSELSSVAIKSAITFAQETGAALTFSTPARISRCPSMAKAR